MFPANLPLNSFATSDLLLLHQSQTITINIAYVTLSVFFIFHNNVAGIIAFLNIFLGINQRNTIFSIFNVISVTSVTKAISFFTSFLLHCCFPHLHCITWVNKLFIWCYIYLSLHLFWNKFYPDLFHQNQVWVSSLDFKNEISNLSISMSEQNEVSLYNTFSRIPVPYSSTFV